MADPADGLDMGATKEMTVGTSHGDDTATGGANFDSWCSGPDDCTEKDGAALLSLEEIESCNLQEMAKDKFKSRLLQRTLLRGSPDVSQLIFKKAEPLFMELVRDQYGNYLSQKILEVAAPDQFERLFNLLKEHLRDLAQDAHGTRAVQKVVEQAINRGKVKEFLEALPMDLAEQLARSVTGFHVIVKLLELLPSEDAEDLLERLCGTPEKALSLGKDQWGCCVAKKCLDRSDGPMRQKIIDAFAENMLSLVQDPFGNYVVQHLILMAHGRPNSNVSRIIDALRGNIFELSMQKFSSNVLEKCLLNSSDKDRNKIINEILNPPHVLPSEAVRMLVFHQFGNYVFQSALEVAKDPQFALLVEHSKQHVQDIIKSGNVDSPRTGKLASEHARRLALKLVKKYQPFSEGLEIDANSIQLAGSWSHFFDPYAPSYGLEGYGGWPGMAPSTLYSSQLAGWDPTFAGYLPCGYPPMKGGGSRSSKGGGGSTSSRARSQGRKASQRPDGRSRGQKNKNSESTAMSPPPCGAQASGLSRGTTISGEGVGGGASGSSAGSGGGQTVRVGRIVGFWPNYTVTYDEVPAPRPGPAGGRGGRSKNRAKGKAYSKGHQRLQAPTDSTLTQRHQARSDE